jgi:hypothetical protein
VNQAGGHALVIDGIPIASPRNTAMSRNGLYALIAILVVVVAGVGYYSYEQSQRPSLEVKLDGNGIKINGN